MEINREMDPTLNNDVTSQMQKDYTGRMREMFIVPFKYSFPEFIKPIMLPDIIKSKYTALTDIIKFVHNNNEHSCYKNVRLIKNKFQTYNGKKWVNAQNFEDKIVQSYLMAIVKLHNKKQLLVNNASDLIQLHLEKYDKLNTERSYDSLYHQLRRIFESSIMSQNDAKKEPDNLEEDTLKKLIELNKKKDKLISKQERKIDLLNARNDLFIREIKILKTKIAKYEDRDEEDSVDEFCTDNVVAFGEELVDIDDNQYIRFLKLGTEALFAIVNHIHGNNKYPTYRNIKVHDENIMIFNGEEWIIAPERTVQLKLKQYIERLHKASLKLEKRLIGKVRPDISTLLINQYSKDKELKEDLLLYLPQVF